MPKISITGNCTCSRRFWILPLPFVIFILIAVIASSIRLGLNKPTDDLGMVNTTSGAFVSKQQNGAILFLGIPYAEPPVDSLRWRPPVPKQTNPAISNATEFAPYCYQTPVSDTLPQSEDCLYLNIFIPGGATPNSSLPVRVWIHGGAFQAGGAPSFMSDLLAVESQTIIVTINYRLGILGFLATTAIIEQNNGQINFGLLDQQLALQWVQDNIAKFGGNPKKVMIWGQSAGGASVAFHLLMPNSWPLYQTALLESPGPWGYLYASQAASINDYVVANHTQCNSDGPEQIVCLEDIDAETLIGLPFQNQPVIDGVQLLDAPLKLFNNGQFNKAIPALLIGNNLVEGNLFAYLYANNSVEMTADQYEQIISQTVLPFVTPQQLSQVMDWYENVVQTSGYWVALSQLTGDCFVNCGTRAIALAYSGSYSLFDSSSTKHQAARDTEYLPISPHIPVYRYAFAHTPLGGENAFLNATHQSEVPFVFSQNVYNLEIQPSEAPLVQSMIATWTRFHETGSPNNGSCNWPTYNSTIIRQSIVHLDLNSCSATNRDVWAQTCDQWMSQLFLTQTNSSSFMFF